MVGRKRSDYAHRAYVILPAAKVTPKVLRTCIASGCVHEQRHSRNGNLVMLKFDKSKDHDDEIKGVRWYSHAEITEELKKPQWREDEI